jgi:hypothetical protein
LQLSLLSLPFFYHHLSIDLFFFTHAARIKQPLSILILFIV